MTNIYVLNNMENTDIYGVKLKFGIHFKITALTTHALLLDNTNDRLVSIKQTQQNKQTNKAQSKNEKKTKLCSVDIAMFTAIT